MHPTVLSIIATVFLSQLAYVDAAVIVENEASNGCKELLVDADVLIYESTYWIQFASQPEQDVTYYQALSDLKKLKAQSKDFFDFMQEFSQYMFKRFIDHPIDHRLMLIGFPLKPSCSSDVKKAGDFLTIEPSVCRQRTILSHRLLHDLGIASEMKVGTRESSWDVSGSQHNRSELHTWLLVFSSNEVYVIDSGAEYAIPLGQVPNPRPLAYSYEQKPDANSFIRLKYMEQEDYPHIFTEATIGELKESGLSPSQLEAPID